MDYRFQNKEDVKLIILTVIHDFNIPVSNAFIVDVVLQYGFAEYFDIQQYLYELSDDEMVTYYTEDSVRYYSVTRKGLEAVEYFSKQIPLSVREKLYSAARMKAKELKDALSIKSEYYRESDMEYTVDLRIIERGYDLFALKLSVGSEKIAKKICAEFDKNHDNIYTEVFSMLVDDKFEE